MQIVLLSGDLMLISLAQGAADRHGVALATAGSIDEACQRCAAGTTGLAAIDLRIPGLDVAETVARLRASAPNAKIVATGPHVQRESLAAAAAAGCDEVITRGQFDSRIDALATELTA